jgi:Fe-S-cluster-containing dehydrogenase component/formate-dependent nitrite reductase membrane component NrfD
MKYGFIIDNRKCIGCHACTVACKTENHVAVGVNRTWVKYVEKGEFPNTRRVFQVTRCNHCEKPPCVTICPVSAMYKRKDGIVDFDSESCIGCKACMQACPYDAIHLDPAHDTASKCNYCAHRTEVGLEPACVIVCPEHAIIAGDLDDPISEIAQLQSRETVRVRKPEQGTKPKLYYIDADEAAIVPTAARHDVFYMWSERNQKVHGGGAAYLVDSPFLQKNALAAYDVAHERPWGWQVPLYLWTKSIGSGVLALPAMAAALGWFQPDRWRDIVLSTIALIFTAITALALVADLTRKDRFLRILLHPQNKSWLARGTYILMLYSMLGGVCWLAAIGNLAHLASIMVWPAIVAGFFAAVYTAFLFGQCEGRDLWQTPLLPVHLIVQTLLCGAAVLALLSPFFMGNSPRTLSVAVGGLALFQALHVIIMLGEVSMPHITDNAGYAVRLITHGPFRSLFWGVAIFLGGMLPLLLLWLAPGTYTAVALASVLALAGLFAFEWCFIMAGQSVPNS